MFADGRFMHADGRARFVALTPRGPEHAPTRDFPLVLNTGRVRDHWHTMTRTGKSARLSAHVAEPFVEVNTADALKFAVREGSLATCVPPGARWWCACAPVPKCLPAWCSRRSTGTRAFASDARVGALANPVVDPISGEPEFKHTPVSIEHFAAAWYGVLLTRAPLPPPAAAWWTKVQGEQFLRYEMAGNTPSDWSLEARRSVRRAH